MILYHGTDVDSALDILNHGLDTLKLLPLQQRRQTQLGIGWYASCEAEVAWFFASLAPGNIGRGYTVIEIDIPEAVLNQLLIDQQAIRNPIANVPFDAQQYWLSADAFEVLNRQAIFQPHVGQEL